MILNTRIAACVIAAVFVTGVRGASAEESLTAARDLYASAAYADALKMLDGLAQRASGDERDTTQLYRAMCLVALGRKFDADAAIQSLVAGNPRFRPAADDVTPRVLTAIRDARRRILPTVLQQEYASSKAAFDSKDYEAASRGFRNLIDALSDPDLGIGGESPLSDLRTLASGFYDLSVKAFVPPVPASAPAPAVVATPAPVVDIARIYSAEDSKVVVAVPVRQDVPKFPTRIVTPQRGVIELLIDETGQVTSASMRVPLASPVYNDFALSTARQWRYRPATLAGVPVKFRKLVQINLTAE